MIGGDVCPIIPSPIIPLSLRRSRIAFETKRELATHSSPNEKGGPTRYAARRTPGIRGRGRSGQVVPFPIVLLVRFFNGVRDVGIETERGRLEVDGQGQDRLPFFQENQNFLVLELKLHQRQLWLHRSVLN